MPRVPECLDIVLSRRDPALPTGVVGKGAGAAPAVGSRLFLHIRNTATKDSEVCWKKAGVRARRVYLILLREARDDTLFLNSQI